MWKIYMRQTIVRLHASGWWSKSCFLDSVHCSLFVCGKCSVDEIRTSVFASGTVESNTDCLRTPKEHCMDIVQRRIHCDLSFFSVLYFCIFCCSWNECRFDLLYFFLGLQEMQFRIPLCPWSRFYSNSRRQLTVTFSFNVNIARASMTRIRI